MKQMERLTSFQIDGHVLGVQYIRSETIWDNLDCDVYKFEDERNKDLRILTVEQGRATSRQLLVAGKKTSLSRLQGSGTAEVGLYSGRKGYYDFSQGQDVQMVELTAGHVVRLHADGMGDFVCALVCEPPYDDTRFEPLAD